MCHGGVNTISKISTPQSCVWSECTLARSGLSVFSHCNTRASFFSWNTEWKTRNKLIHSSYIRFKTPSVANRSKPVTDESLCQKPTYRQMKRSVTNSLKLSIICQLMITNPKLYFYHSMYWSTYDQSDTLMKNVTTDWPSGFCISKALG